MKEKYNHKDIEKKWQEKWLEMGLYNAEDNLDKKKWYGLIEFPYPSGAGLHVGHVRSHVALDIVARKKRMEGFNVLYPIGWDAFGLPTENFAIKTKQKPQVVTEENVKRFRKQIQSYGVSFDWSREINTTDPEYYKWTQWIFLQMFKKGLAYRDKMFINWCPACKIGLANEEVVDGKCERCGAETEKKEKEQWMLAITKYADRLIDDLDTVDFLPKIAIQQKNWIGRSEGAEIDFVIAEKEMVDINRDGGGDSYQDEIEEIERDNVVVIIEHPTDDKFLCAKWKKVDWSGFVTGGLDDDTPEQTAIDEVREETGYQNPEVVKVFEQCTHGKFYHVGKKINRFAHYKIVHIKLKNLEKVEASDEEKEIADFLWINRDKVDGFLKREDMKYPWRVFECKNTSDKKFTVFTTRPDTLFGCTYCVLSPEHKLLDEMKGEIENWEEVQSYREKANKKTEIERTDNTKEKTGVELKGVRAINPANKKEVPIFVADYVLNNYGTGAIMAVPAHDERDFEFAKKFGIEIIKAIDTKEDLSFEYGNLINSDEFNGLTSKEAKKGITEFVGGKLTTQFKLQDWVFSRQRYWGEPIPLIYCEKCGIVPVPEKDLPVKLPNVDSYEPTDTGESPLAKIIDWVNVKCPKCNGEAKRETDTMPNWAGSSWYFLRYTDHKNDEKLAGEKALKYWTPIDLYNGGMEHTTLHLLYSRFWHKFLFDIGVVPTIEPYKKRISHGMILAHDGQKMSKSKGNVVNPDEVIENVGADTLRVYEMFMGPFGQAIAWSTDDMVGSRRFLEKVWGLSEKVSESREVVSLSETKTPLSGVDEILLNKTIKKVTDDIENFDFNTAISSMMILVNDFEKKEKINKIAYEKFLKILSPFAPHITEELWKELGNNDSIHKELWPEYDKLKLQDEKIKIIVQINGKVRDSFEVEADIAENEAIEKALNLEKVKNWIGDKEIKRKIFVKGKLINIVI